MPKYYYQVVDDEGNRGNIVELEHSMNDKITHHPETGEELVCLYTAPQLSGMTKKSKGISDNLGAHAIDYVGMDVNTTAYMDSEPVDGWYNGTLVTELTPLYKKGPAMPGMSVGFDPSLN